MEVDQEYEMVDVSGLLEHPRNPRRGVVEAIDESIEVNGWYGVIVAQRSTRFILAGNHRYRAAKMRGAARVPVVWRDCDDETALRILLADNKTADLGTYDQEVLDAVMTELDDLKGTGYIQSALGALEALEEAEEALEEASEVPDDQYTPTYGVMIVLATEEAQQGVYEWLQPFIDEGLENWAVGAKLRVVAV